MPHLTALSVLRTAGGSGECLPDSFEAIAQLLHAKARGTAGGGCGSDADLVEAALRLLLPVLRGPEEERQATRQERKVP